MCTKLCRTKLAFDEHFNEPFNEDFGWSSCEIKLPEQLRRVLKKSRKTFFSKIIFQNFRVKPFQIPLWKHRASRRAKESATAIRTYEPPPAHTNSVLQTLYYQQKLYYRFMLSLLPSVYLVSRRCALATSPIRLALPSHLANPLYSIVCTRALIARRFQR